MLINVTTGEILVRKIEHGNTPARAAVGLLGKKTIDMDYAMILHNCRFIHTCFMKFPIDVVFLNKNKHVVHIVRNLSPWKLTGYVKNAEYVIEAKPEGMVGKIALGDQLNW